MDIERYYRRYPGTPGRPDNSVHYSDFRFRKAKEQAELEKVSVEIIIKHVNQLLSDLGMPEIQNPVMDPKTIDYRSIKEQYGLADVRDIVWLKFTEDGILGCVATSNDVAFDIPASEEEYHLFGDDGRRLHTTAGILLHMLGKRWDERFALVFPLKDIPEGKSRGNIECAIGNYLIEKGVPILDFYSHNW